MAFVTSLRFLGDAAFSMRVCSGVWLKMMKASAMAATMSIQALQAANHSHILITYLPVTVCLQYTTANFKKVKTWYSNSWITGKNDVYIAFFYMRIFLPF